MRRAAPASVSSSPASGLLADRESTAVDRRKAILDAALDVFAERGYAGARLEDVATRAGVGKGTIYLYFSDKRALFIELVRGAAAPIFEQIGELSRLDAPIDAVLRQLFALFRQNVLGTRRKEVFQLMISEGARFPDLAEFYHREVIAPMLPGLGALLERAWRRGELPGPSIARYPHLLVAPLVFSLLWDVLFGAIEPLDTAALLDAHLAALLGQRGDSPP
jgi:AcrR family transcriptional regulator